MKSVYEKETGLQNTSDSPDTCWKQIGVFSRKKASCSELKKVIHCRNCNRFIKAGRNLLERELPLEYLEEWTKVIGTKKTEEVPGTISVLIFRICEEWLAFSTRLFSEIIDPVRIHTLPHRKNPVLMGLVNVNGEIQLCISLEKMLDLKKSYEKTKEKKGYKRMMVINNEGEQWVFPVDEIHGIYRVHPDTFQNIPVTLEKSKSSYTRDIFSWENKNVAFLDDGLIFTTLKRSVQ